MFRVFFIFSLLLGISTECASQRIIKPKLVEVDWKGIIYKKEWSIDLRIHENGAAIAYNSGTIKSYYRTNYYHLELGFYRDPRERSQTKVSRQGRSGSFTLGKINSLINVRGGVGVKKYLSEKEKRRGLAVGYTAEIGPSIALLKPYFLELITTNPDQSIEITTEKFSEDNADRFLDVGSINKRASFFRGIDQTSVRAGIQGKIGLHLAMGAFDKTVRAFETGIMFDIYPSKIPILLETEDVSARRMFFAFYLNLQLGSRSN